MSQKYTIKELKDKIENLRANYSPEAFPDFKIIMSYLTYTRIREELFGLALNDVILLDNEYTEGGEIFATMIPNGILMDRPVSMEILQEEIQGEELEVKKKNRKATKKKYRFKKRRK